MIGASLNFNQSTFNFARKKLFSLKNLHSAMRYGSGNVLIKGLNTEDHLLFIEDCFNSDDCHIVSLEEISSRWNQEKYLGNLLSSFSLTAHEGQKKIIVLETLEILLLAQTDIGQRQLLEYEISSFIDSAITLQKKIVITIIKDGFSLLTPELKSRLATFSHITQNYE